jgi:release factor glutamine methyltransferase
MSRVPAPEHLRPRRRRAGPGGAHSLADALDGATTAIAAAGCDTPRLDAELLLAHVLGVPRERLVIDSRLELAGPGVHAFREAVRRRAALREPVAYITGRRAFARLELAVDHRALIPRPETELLVEVALAQLSARSRVLDVGTGCGAVALALKDARAGLQVAGSDVSEAAIELARENARRLQLDVAFMHADLLQGVRDEFDAVVANLPYVADGERVQLAPEITRHEPPLALFAGKEGLAAIAALLEQLAGRARARFVALEIGAGQGAAVASLVRRAGFGDVGSERDLAGIERVVHGRR